MNLNQVTLPATDLKASVAFYLRLGFEQIVDAPHYARFACPNGDATFSVHLADIVGASGVVTYFECDDLDRQVAALERAGIAFDSPPVDQPWLWREARLRDPASNVLCLYHAGVNRKDLPCRVSLRA